MKKISAVLIGLVVLFSWWGYVVIENKNTTPVRDAAAVCMDPSGICE